MCAKLTSLKFILPKPSSYNLFLKPTSIVPAPDARNVVINTFLLASTPPDKHPNNLSRANFNSNTVLLPLPAVANIICLPVALKIGAISSVFKPCSCNNFKNSSSFLGKPKLLSSNISFNAELKFIKY